MRGSIAITIALSACGKVGFSGDAGPDAQVDASAPAANYAFVTSTTQLPTTFGADLSGADAVCMQRAAAAGLPGRYVAWLSSPTVNARDRLQGARGWIRVDGKPVVDRVEDLIAGHMYYPIRLDEFGDDIGDSGPEAATATLAAGTEDFDCDGYTNPATGIRQGLPWYTMDGWTTDTIASCTSVLRLYCFGVDRSVMLPPPQAQGRVAFVTAQPFTMGGGLPAADAHCMSEAQLGHLTGSFRAMLGTAGASASSRFDLNGSPWVRVDGVLLADSALGFLTGPRLSSLAVDQLGNPNDRIVYTGGDPVAPSFYNCTDWTSTAAMGTEGRSDASNLDIYGWLYSSSCGDVASLYCLEQ